MRGSGNWRQKIKKLLALDLDGTLLRSDKTLNPDDIAAVARVRALGVVVTIITGRLSGGSRPIAQRLGLSAPIGCNDGCHILDPVTGRDLEFHH